MGIVIAFVGGIGQSVARIVVGIACDDGYRVVAEVGVEQGGVGGEAAVGIGVMVDGVVEGSHIPFVDGVGFEVGDGDEFMVGMAAQGREAEVVFMDPPRAGSDKKFLNALLKLKPERVVYISCNPETLARDLKHLTSGGYRVKKIQPVDQFPMTDKVEAVVSLSR